MLFTLIFFLHDGAADLALPLPGSPRRAPGSGGRRRQPRFRRAGLLHAGQRRGRDHRRRRVGIGLTIVGVPLAVPLVGAGLPRRVRADPRGVRHRRRRGPGRARRPGPVVGAIVVLAILVAVMQIEGHVLQPLLLGKAVQIHPLAVVLTIAVGLTSAGIPGALLAVPLLAVLNASIRSLLAPEDETVDADGHRRERRPVRGSRPLARPVPSRPSERLPARAASGRRTVKAVRPGTLSTRTVP